MAENGDASYYTMLVHACGYSYSFLPNLILIIILLVVMLLICLILIGRDVSLKVS